MARIKRVPARGLFFAALAFGIFYAASCTSALVLVEKNAAGETAFAVPAREPLIPANARPHIREQAAFLPAAIAQSAAWQPVTGGVEMFEWKVPKTKIHNRALKIDLSNEALQVIGYPLNARQDGVFAAKTAAAFANETGAAVVINATPFETPSGPLSKKRALSGVYAVDGVVLSSPRARYAALGFTRDNSAFIMKSQTEPIPDDARLVAGGFFSILEDGAIVPFAATSLNARMAAGISGDKKTLYILCVKGNGGAFARGMSYEECALVLFLLGADDALQMDGGSSTSLAVNGKTLAGRFGITPANLLGFTFNN
jgi:hypothetical protein